MSRDDQTAENWEKQGWQEWKPEWEKHVWWKPEWKPECVWWEKKETDSRDSREDMSRWVAHWESRGSPSGWVNPLQLEPRAAAALLHDPPAAQAGWGAATTLSESRDTAAAQGGRQDSAEAKAGWRVPADAQAAWSEPAKPQAEWSSEPAKPQAAWGDTAIAEPALRKPAEVQGWWHNPEDESAAMVECWYYWEDAEKAASDVRWRRFQHHQDWNAEHGILHAKTEEQIQADEQRLFSQGACSVPRRACWNLCDITGPNVTTFADMFASLGDFVPHSLVGNVHRCGYEKPTPVQKITIPEGLLERDVLVIAETGTGKTASFLIPILAGMMKHIPGMGSLTAPFQGCCQPHALVMSPTPEVCLQIYEEAEKFTHKTPFRCARLDGGSVSSREIQTAHIAKGADLIVATPQRLWDFVSCGIISVKAVQCVVLDEADRMLSFGMECFISEIVEKFGMPPKEERQTMLFSATLPEDLQKLAMSLLRSWCIEDRLQKIAKPRTSPSV
jgi:hypothetical protein